MKKKLLGAILSMTLILGALTGCGSTTSDKAVTAAGSTGATSQVKARTL